MRFPRLRRQCLEQAWPWLLRWGEGFSRLPSGPGAFQGPVMSHLVDDGIGLPPVYCEDAAVQGALPLVSLLAKAPSQQVQQARTLDSQGALVGTPVGIGPLHPVAARLYDGSRVSWCLL